MKNLIFGVFVLFICNQIQAQEGKFAEVNGVKLYYEIHGDGEPLLLLHGFTMSHDMWLPWVDNLSKDYQIILVDLRGHGKSSNPSNEFTHRQSAEDIFALMNFLGIKEFKAMGVSSGGMTLTHMATMDTTRIQSLILIGSTTYFPETSRVLQKDATYENVSAKNPGWMEYMRRVQPGGEAQIRNLLRQFNRMADSYDDMNFTSPYLSTIKCHTLIIHGDRDQHFPVDIPVNSYKSMPNAYLWIIPNFRHNIPNKETPLGNIFLNTITQFLAGDWN